jgi:hypothetical protein
MYAFISLLQVVSTLFCKIFFKITENLRQIIVPRVKKKEAIFNNAPI